MRSTASCGPLGTWSSAVGSVASGSRVLYCPICGASDPSLRYRITRFSIVECTGCEQIFLWPVPDEEEIRELFSQLYTTGEGSVPELRDYYGYCFEDEPTNPLVRQYERWLDSLERLSVPGRLLDVGCGTGLFLAVARRRGWEPFGIDDCVEAGSHAREHFGLDIWLGDFSEFSGDGRRFDLITGWDILEHARDPVGLLRDMRRCLAAELFGSENQHAVFPKLRPDEVWNLPLRTAEYMVGLLPEL